MAKFILEDGTPARQHRPRLAELLSTTTGIIRVATAYVTDRHLLSAVGKRETRLLTSLAPMDVASGATSLETLDALMGIGIKCRVLPQRPRLHAKVYIFGSSHAVVTSANLTGNAFDSNIEVGVTIAGSDAKRLLDWFDGLWDIGTPLKTDDLTDLHRQTSALRHEFAKLKRKVNSKSPPPPPSKSQAALSDSLQHLFSTATRFFVCNTDRKQGGRTATGGFELEERMHTRGYAAAWEDFKFPSHMETVEPGNAVFMFAKRVGIIGVGVAEGPCEKLVASQPERISHVHTDVEWRVPTRWLAWVGADRAFPWDSPNFTFWDVTESQYDKFRAEVMAHFLAEG